MASADADDEDGGDSSHTCLTIIHFNDCYNVEPRSQEPSGGAARFCSALKSFAQCEPIILFSGDLIGPSIMSTFTKGEQMIAVVNECGIHCALFGNHEFDFGVDNLIEFVGQTNCPWLMSNVIDKETDRPLGEGKIYHILEAKGKKIGIIGLIEEQWLVTLGTLSVEDLIYADFVTEGRKLAKYLREKERVDLVIALTHMRTPNDCRLAESVDEIDLILGGHDHDYDVRVVNGKHIIKSGTDFRQFSKIELTFDSSTARPAVDVKEIRVNSADFAEDDSLKAKLERFSDTIEGKMDTVLAHFGCELDGRFSIIRTAETNLGNLICDIALASTHSDVALLNSGTFRCDTLYPSGPFTMRDLVRILPLADTDPLIVIGASGQQIVEALENGVSEWPKLEGRFPQVSGVTFAFDPSKPAGRRIDAKSVKIGDKSLEPTKTYRLVTKQYMHRGKDGYDVLKECAVLQNSDECPNIVTSVQNHFEAVRILSEDYRKNHRNKHHAESLSCLAHRQWTSTRTANHDCEFKHCRLEPIVEGRITTVAN